jgi:hypothetical protein
MIPASIRSFKVTPIRNDVSLRSAAFAACAIARRRTNSRSTAVFRVVICGNCLLEGVVVFGILKGRDHGLEGQCVTNCGLRVALLAGFRFQTCPSESVRRLDSICQSELILGDRGSGFV